MGPFRDRADAGRQLAARLAVHRGETPVVLALPRGGVPVAFEVARALDAPLDVLVARALLRLVHEAGRRVEGGVEIELGSVDINPWVYGLHIGYDEMPFGGVKYSGFGREHGPEALEYYLETKGVVVATP